MGVLEWIAVGVGLALLAAFVGYVIYTGTRRRKRGVERLEREVERLQDKDVSSEEELELLKERKRLKELLADRQKEIDDLKK